MWEADMLREKVFDTGTVKINYAEGPQSGPPLVLLHGGGDRWQDFLPIIPSLVMRWQVFALDLRGHGKSGRVPGQYRPEHYVEDVVTFLKRQLVDQAILFGHSLGGWIALLAAAQQKDKVEALILGDPPMNLDRFLAIENSKERIDMWRRMRELAGSGLTVPELASALADSTLTDSPLSGEALGWAKTLSLVDPDAAQYHAEGRLDEYIEQVDLEGALRQLRCPVLLVQGDPSQGGLVSDEDVERVLAMLADGAYVRLDGRGHNLGLSTWEVAPLLRAIVSFLESF
jgi:pimeloyl-ACP methyl ester carboxylesterase